MPGNFKHIEVRHPRTSNPEDLPPREYMSLIYEEAYTSSYMAQCFEEDAAAKYGMESDKYQVSTNPN